jgi:hypothetical protein
MLDNIDTIRQAIEKIESELIRGTYKNVICCAQVIEVEAKSIIEQCTAHLGGHRCYFCNDIPATNRTRIAESPKDFEAGGIQVWICDKCAAENE